MSDLETSFTPKRKKSTAGRVFDIVLDIVIVLLVAVVAARLFFSPVKVQGTSMDDTLYSGERLLISNVDKNYSVGDIVVIGRENDESIIKRIIAVGGDKIAFVKNPDGTVDLYRNDFTQPVKEDYIKERMIRTTEGYEDLFSEVRIADSAEQLASDEYVITVKEGQVFVMGDNRNVSADSRSRGCMDVSAIKGKTVAIITGNWFLNLLFPDFE